MALEIKGMNRVFKMKKNGNELLLDRSGQQPVTGGSDGFLFHELSGTDHRIGTRTGN